MAAAIAHISRTRSLVTLGTLLLIGGLLCGYISLLRVDGMHLIEWWTLGLFAILGGWIAFSFTIAVLGAVRLASRARESEDSRTIVNSLATPQAGAASMFKPSTAILVPIYNESPQDVLARIESMGRSLHQLNQSHRFAFYVLSDTTRPDVWLREEAGWAALAKRLEGIATVYYRHRNRNISRKSGNIADFVERWGSAYSFMIVLDADSLMTGEAMVAMVDRMEADAKLGILQIGPRPIGRRSVLARVQQFASAAYGPLFNEGFAAWSGEQGNYWGHNAIIRVAAFQQCCDLPVLPGKAPLGGEILSHDFVEAALMVRRGWKVVLATDLDGSYEECPTTLSDYAQRDQRWCQGNLQHSRLLISEGFHPLSRLHFFSGIMGYVSSPLWLLLMGLSLLSFSYLDAAADDATWWTRNGHWVLFATMFCLLLAPKWMSYWLIVGRGEAAKFGGAMRLAVSMLLEIVWSVLIAPVIGLLHARFVVGILIGKTVKWNAQQRSERGVPLAAAWADYGWLSLLGLMLIAGSWYLSGDSQLWLWFLPVTLGLSLTVPLAMACGSLALGQWLYRNRLWVVPEDLVRPRIVEDFELALERSSSEAAEEVDWFERMLSDDKYLALHDSILCQTDSVVTMSDDQRASVMQYAKQGISMIPVNLRRDVLLDPELMHRLYLQKSLTSPSLVSTVGI